MAAYAAVLSLKQGVARTLLYCGVLLPPPLLEIFEFAHKELKSFQEFLERLDSSSRERMNAPLGRIPAATRKFLKVLGSHWDKIGENQADRYRIQISTNQLENLKQDLHSFIETLKKTEEEYYCYPSPGGNKKSKMVGLSDEYSKLKEDIVSNLMKIPVFSLVGMTGIGKTTLAKEIFQDLDIMELFDCRAWVKVGQEFKPEEITKALLAQVDLNDTGGSCKYLDKCLKGKRYLIVLDDVWNEDVYDCLRSSFPNNKNGSLVLLTTTMWCVAKNANMFSKLFHMRLLNKDESWHLLQNKVFGESWCPPRLEEAGKMIAEKCDGLPLTIITIANLLSKAPESLWIEVATHKKHQLFTDAYDEISKVLYPSYNHLTEHFKRCFLYIGVFRQNYEIPRSKLINLWVAEEFFEPSGNTTLQYDAVECLHNLSFRSLVMIYQSSIYLSSVIYEVEGVKTCGLHSSWWHFCQREARKTKLFHVLDSYEDGVGEGITGQSRLSIHNNVLLAIKDVYNSMEENCASTAHSLLCFGPYHQYPVPICFRLKLLQKLDAFNTRFYEFPLEVLELDELRYLTLTCNGELPPSISKLKLQFLIVNRHLSIKSHGSLSCLPSEIWDMEKLKHLQVTGCDLPDLGHTLLHF